MKYYRSELFSSFLGAALYLADSVEDGWKLNNEDLPHIAGFSYYISLVRDDEPVVKLTRAEILMKARAAKTVNKLKEANNE